MRGLVIVAISAVAIDASAETGDASVDATARLGVTKAPFEAPGLPEAKGHGLVLLVEGSYAVAPGFVAGLRIPAVLVSVAQPAGSYADRAALGNPQLRVTRQAFHRRSISVVAGLELGAPLAGHDHDLMPNRALAIADGIEGHAAPELFAPGMLPIVGLGELAFASAPWTVDVSIRLPLLVRVSDASMPSATTNAVGFAAILSARAQRRLTGRLAAAISSQVAADVAPAHESTRDRGRVQDLERLGLTIRLGRRSELAITFQAAIGGDLGGSTFGGGVGMSSTF
jgi:hypothetical protein